MFGRWYFKLSFINDSANFLTLIIFFSASSFARVICMEMLKDYLYSIGTDLYKSYAYFILQTLNYLYTNRSICSVVFEEITDIQTFAFNISVNIFPNS